MRVDNYYSQIDKENFYLGIISQVYRSNSCVQVENLTLLRDRKIRNEVIIPNTINYLVVVEDVQGLFICEVYQSRVQDTDKVNQAISNGKEEHVFPELSIDVIGYMTEEGHFNLPGFRTVGINDKVYVANRKIISEYIDSIEVNKYINQTTNKKQKKLCGLANLANMDEISFSIQPNSLFDRHLLVVGSTNSGKSTSSLAILDRLINTKRKVMIIDPTGEYQESFPEKNINKLVLGEDTFLSAGKVSMAQWELLFQTNDNTQGAVLADAIKSLRYQTKCGDPESVYIKKDRHVQDVDSELAVLSSEDREFNLKLLPEQVNAESVEIGTQRSNRDTYVFQNFRANTNSWLIQKIEHEFEYSSLIDFFNESSGEKLSLMTELDKFCQSKTDSLYIDASRIGTTDGMGSMIIDLISHYLIAKDRKDIEPFVMFIDETHRYTRFSNEGIASLSGLVNIAREGRKKGIFLFLTTQSPKDVPQILFSQIGSLLVHRLTGIEDLQMIRSYLDERNQKRITILNQGEALLTSINLLQDVQLKFIKSKRIHRNDTPVL